MGIDYLAVGNPTLDLQPDGSPVIGGTVVYGAVQAARLGYSVKVVGRANVAELSPVLPSDDRITWNLQSAPATTTFANLTEDDERVQRILANAGRVALGPDPLVADVVHLGPVCAEVDLRDACLLAADAGFVGVTPQGAFRVWDEEGLVGLRSVTYGNAVCDRVDAVVVGHNEATVAEPLLRAIAEQGGLAVVTRGSVGCEVWSGSTHDAFPVSVSVAEIDATGAGDIFAATLFLRFAEGAGLAEAVRYAHGAAAASVRGIGVSAIADVDELSELLDQA